MNLLFRLLYTAFSARFRPSCDVMGPCRTTLRVLPNDLDVLWHVNNGRYLSLLDLGRTDLMLRSGLYSKLRARDWYSVITAETIQFHRPLELFDRFTIETCVLGWDHKAFLLEQRFLQGERLAADAVVRARFLKRGGGSVLPEQVLALDGRSPASPELPDWVARWNEDQVTRRRLAKRQAAHTRGRPGAASSRERHAERPREADSKGKTVS